MSVQLDQRNSSQELTRIFGGETAVFEFPGVMDATFRQISGFVFRLLFHYDLAFLNEVLLVVLKEILSNCAKANAKRIFFDEQKVDITDNEAYDKAIKDYSRTVLRDWSGFYAKHRTSKYYIRLSVQVKEEAIHFALENNSEIVQAEWARIKTKFQSYERFGDIHKAFAEIRDDSEGAGLGIFFVLSLLENAGIPPKNYKLNSGQGKTRTEVSVPLNIASEQFRSDFYGRVLKEIEELPSFPENITNLLDLCESETSSVAAIAREIQKDPALTAQILKLVNSAGYMSRNRNPNLEDAVKIIGLKVIRNLLMVTGARNVIENKYRLKELEAIWEDSNRVSFFARKLARRRNGSLVEQVTVAGLLYELGKIVMFALRPDESRSIQDVLDKARVRSSTVLEESMLGISHPEIGAFMAQNWKFPETLVTAIRYQHKPLLAPEEQKDIAEIIYAAAAIQEASRDRLDYWSTEPEVFERFNIASESDFSDIVKALDKEYRELGDTAL